MNIEKAKNIHFIGIGGIGVSSIAQILRKEGKKISGSDSTPSEITKSLKLSEIKVKIGHDEKNVSKKHDLIVYSPAIPASNPELKKAKTLGIKNLTYPQALGELTKKYFTIAIAGTHGKSTTTAMTALILEKAGLDPTIVIGTKMEEFKNRNFRVGESKYLVIEACEYKKSFLNFNPDILLITNIEADHLDYYKNFANYKKAFELLVKKVPKTGKIIINSEDKIAKSLTKNAKGEIISWKKTPESIELNFSSKKNKKVVHEIKIKPGVPGEFNVSNASSAAAIGLILPKIEINKIEQAIRKFKGTWRRMEYKKKNIKNTIFIDDYAHHPTEIELTLNAIREKYPKKSILCIFQPHQYSRTHLLLKDLGESFTIADKVIIPNIYKVRDSKEDIKKVSTDDLVNEIKKNGGDSINGNGLQKTADYIKTNHKNFDIIITMGAGDIDSIYKMF